VAYMTSEQLTQLNLLRLPSRPHLKH